MGQYTSALQAILERKFAKKMPREEAFRQVRRANHKSIDEWYEHIDSINDRFDNHPPDPWKQVIASVRAAIAAEEQLLKDLDELERSPWATAP